MTSIFSHDHAPGKALTDWWTELQDNNAARAELRRAKTVADVVLLPHFQRSCHRFQPFFQHERRWQGRLAMVFGLLSHVQKRSSHTLPRQMAGDPPKLSEMRFRRLIQYKKREDIYLPMIRVIRKLDKEVNLHDLADSIYYWGDGVKREWSFEYFSNTPEKSFT